MISVIVPIYNIEKYIARCIESILMQSYSNFELILVNDGSIDSSQKICEEYASMDSRIIVISKQNGGLSDARNVGTKQAKGDWITYIDGDDFVHPKYLVTLLSLCQQNNVQVSVVQSMIVRNPEKINFNIRNENTTIMTGKEAALEIVRYNKMFMITANGKLYHRDLIPFLHYPINKIHEDEFVTYKVFYKVDRVAVSNLPYYYYYVRNNSITQAAYSQRRLDKLEALKDAIDFFNENFAYDAMEYAWLRYVLNVQIAWYRVKTNMAIQNKEMLLSYLQYEQKQIMKDKGIMLFRRATVTERITLTVFTISPNIYAWICAVVLCFQSVY